MKQFIAYTKKEFIEAFRTYKLFVVSCIFLILGMMNPLSAKFLPDIIYSIQTQGISINVPEPTAIDSWMQFFKNVPQIGLIVIVIVFSGVMANEYSKGTLVILLTKGLKRRTVILSKFITMISIWTFAYLLCSVVSYAYTMYFWNEKVDNAIFAVFCLYIFGILMLSAILLGGVIFKSTYGSIIFAGILYVFLNLINIIEKVKEYNPVMLASSNMSLINLDKSISDFYVPLCISVLLTAIFVGFSIKIFNKSSL